MSAVAFPSPPVVPADDGARARDDGAKRRQVLDGAREVFLADGFDGASMNEIARVAGVSKGTLYVYFDSKEALFEALIREEKREQAEYACQFDHANPDVDAVLREFGERLLERMFKPSAIAHLRIVAAVAQKLPSIGRAFYEAGPLVGRTRLGEYLEAQVEAGIMDIADTTTAASFFLDMCKSCHLLPVLLCAMDAPSARDLNAHVALATATFLRAYPVLARADGARNSG